MDLPDLRPLSFGELLDRTFTYYRRHFWTFVGIMAVPQVMIVAVNVVLQSFQSMEMARVTSSPPDVGLGGESAAFAIVAGSFLSLIVYFVLYSVALGATTYAVSEIHLGRPTAARAAYRNMRGRYWRLADLIFTVIVRVILVFILILFGSALAAGATGALASSLAPLGGILTVLTMLALIVTGSVFAVWFFLRYGCSVPALLLENLRAGAALKRSVALTKGNTGRIFLISVLMGLINVTVAGILQGPFLVAMLFMAAKNHGQPPLWLAAAVNIAGGVGKALTGSLLTIGLVLLYYDIRVRKEGFDLQLMMAALEAQSPVEGAGPAQLVSPTAPLALERKSVLFVILLTLVTFGLYYPYWFIRSRTGINSLNSSEKIGLVVPVFVFVLWLSEFALDFLSGVIEGLHSIPHTGLAGALFSGLPAFNSIASLAGGILLLIQAFKVKQILEAHTTVPTSGPLAGSLHLVQGSSYSALATFFLGIYYLQYKINEIVDASAQSPAGVGVIPAL